MPRMSLGANAREALYALSFGLLGACAFPPVGLWPLGLISPALLLLLIRDRDTTDARNLGLLYGIAVAGGTMHWFVGLFGPLAISLLALMAGYWGLFTTLVAMTRGQRLVVRALLTGMFAVGVEWFRGDAWYLRFPWFTPPHALATDPAWIAPVRWIGVYGLSFSLWVVAALGAFGYRAIWLCFLLLPAFAWLLPPIGTPDRRALLVQAEGVSEAQMLLFKMPMPSGKIDLVVLPELAYLNASKPVSEGPSGPGEWARKLAAPVVFGAVEGNYFAGPFDNVAAVLGPDGEILGLFPKQRPVPLVRDGTPGTKRPVFPVDGGILGVAICYDFDAPEVAASLVSQGATVLVAPTYDAMSWSSVQHNQHELLLRLRAVENDRWVLRSASSGRSEAINPHGVPSTEGVAIGETGVVTVEFGHRTDRPFGGQAHLLGPIFASGTLVFLIVCWIRRWRQWKATRLGRAAALA